MEENKKTTATQESETVEKKEKVKEEFNVDKLSEKECKKLLKSLIKENEEVNASLEKAEEEAKSNKESWYRTAADFENFKKRNQDTRINAYRDGKIDVITKLLVIGDSLDRALSMELDEKTKAGIELTARQFEETLASEGVTSINPVGETFDPNTSEAIMKMPANEGEVEGTVKQVFLKGYKMGERVIRYAQVVVVG
ncbi:MAG: nucleotide exchange factor GrpE [Clostridia bacterium]|nr:nucleotide exchange factor GrpE [Clostridia bacterium]